MSIYPQIFIDSLQSVIILSTRQEWVYFAALGFGGYDMTKATFVAIAGSTLGMSINFWLGYYLSMTRSRWPHYDDVFYKKLTRIGSWLALLLLAPQWTIWSAFLPLFTAFLGAVRVRPLLALAVIVSGRIVYYAYYLLNA